MSWPQTPPLTTDALDQNTDDLTAARVELEAAVIRLNEVLLEAADGATLITDANDGAYAKVAAANVFSLLQTIQRSNAALLRLNNTNTGAADYLELRRQTAIVWAMLVQANNTLFIRNNDSSGGISVAQDASLLAMTSTGLTYGGQPIGNETTLGTEGQVVLGGVVMKWGYATDDSLPVVFPEAYTNAVYSLQLSNFKISATATVNSAPHSFNVTTTQFEWQKAAGVEGVYWQAIGL